MEQGVPTIDIAELDSPATRAAIDRACRDWGFFQVVNHGIDAGVTGDLQAAMRAAPSCAGAGKTQATNRLGACGPGSERLTTASVTPGWR